MPKNNNKLHRFQVYSKGGFMCAYCKREFYPPKNWDKKKAINDGIMWLEIDHIIPLSKGGRDTIDNKQCLCQRCNNRKSNKIIV